MKLEIKHPALQVMGLGVLAGMRSTSAPMIASHILSHHHSKLLDHSVLGFMQSSKVATAMKVMAVSEFIGDKLPSAPNRIRTAGLVFRCLAGALAGASIYKAVGKQAIVGGAIGAASALASTFGSYYLRKDTVKLTHVFDPIIGAIEDALVLGTEAGIAYAVEV